MASKIHLLCTYLGVYPAFRLIRSFRPTIHGHMRCSLDVSLALHSLERPSELPTASMGHRACCQQMMMCTCCLWYPGMPHSAQQHSGRIFRGFADENVLPTAENPLLKTGQSEVIHLRRCTFWADSLARNQSGSRLGFRQLHGSR